PIKPTSAPVALTVAPIPWVVDKALTLSIEKPGLTSVTSVSVCLDENEALAAEPKDVTFDANGSARVTVTIPVSAQRPAGALPGDHTLTVQLSDGTKSVFAQTPPTNPVPPKPPVLTTVRPTPLSQAGGHVQMELAGEHFDVDRKDLTIR